MDNKASVVDELLEDLRFFIGLFFLIVGAILIAQGLIHPVETAGVNLNFDVGLGFLVFSFFALLMVFIGFRNRASARKDPSK